MENEKWKMKLGPSRADAGRFLSRISDVVVVRRRLIGSSRDSLLAVVGRVRAGAARFIGHVPALRERGRELADFGHVERFFGDIDNESSFYLT